MGYGKKRREKEVMKHSPFLLPCFHQTDHAGVLDKSLGVVKSACAGTVEQGDVVTLFVLIEAGRIAQITFQAYGSVAIIGGGECLCRWLEGKTVLEARRITTQDILTHLQFSELNIHTASLLGQVLARVLE